MRRDAHLRLDEMLLGRAYPEVHRWMDACFGNYLPGGKHESYGSAYYHWCERHSLEALAARYGTESEEFKAGKIHVVADWISHWGIVEFPKDKDEVVRLLDKNLCSQ